MMRILIVDDYPLFREGLGQLISQLYPTGAIFSVGSFEAAMRILKRYGHFELIMLDASLPDIEGLMGLQRLQQHDAAIPVVILSDSTNPTTVLAALEQGARGYILKTAEIGDVKNALQLVQQGETYISPAVLTAVQTLPAVATAPLPELVIDEPWLQKLGLTHRQFEVLCLMVQGLPNKTIANRLQCSEGTVKLHVSAILRALHARNRTEAVQAANRLGICS